MAFGSEGELGQQPASADSAGLIGMAPACQACRSEWFDFPYESESTDRLDHMTERHARVRIALLGWVFVSEVSGNDAVGSRPAPDSWDLPVERG